MSISITKGALEYLIAGIKPVLEVYIPHLIGLYRQGKDVPTSKQILEPLKRYGDVDEFDDLYGDRK